MNVKPGYKLTEVGVIPEDWEVSLLGDCGTVTMGQSPPGTSYNLVGDGSPLINGPTEFTDRSPVKIQWTTMPVRFCKSGDLLICVRGSSTGRTNFADDVYAIGRGVAAIRAAEGHSTVFLSCQVIRGVAEILKAATGSTFPSVDGASFRRMPIPLPPTRAEQEAIAGALSDADALIESLEQLIAKKRQIKHGAMQQLLTGKKRLPGFLDKWESRHLGELGKCIRGVSYNPTSDLYPFDTHSSVRLLRSNNVQEATVVLSDIQFVDSSRVAIDQYLEQNDVLICMANGSRELVGKAGRFMDDDGYRYTFGAFMGAFRPNCDRSDKSFAFYLFHTDAYRRHINVLLAGSSINNLTPASIESLAIEVPPTIIEQAAIAEVLVDMDTEIAAIETKLAKARQIKQGMMQELLTGRTRLI